MCCRSFVHYYPIFRSAKLVNATLHQIAERRQRVHPHKGHEKAGERVIGAILASGVHIITILIDASFAEGGNVGNEEISVLVAVGNRKLEITV